MNKRQRKKQYSRLVGKWRRGAKKRASRYQSVRKHGCWEIEKLDPHERREDAVLYRCSECRRLVLAAGDLEITWMLPYCVCGAKMDGGVER